MNYMKLLTLTNLMLIITSMILLYKSIFISINIPLLILFPNMSINIIIDWMSLTFITSVLIISSMIMMFSTNYISPNQHKQFSLILILFITSMIVLILSDNLILLILGWDGLGLSSYILVIFYQNYSSAASGSITILTNRLGDIMILLSIASMLNMNNTNLSNNNFPLIISMLIMVAAISKSAQFPFSAWLPAAMAAPTPISALVHSSTLVTAGVFILVRIMNNNLMMLSKTLLISSSLTAIYSSLSAMWENDMKKIIAMSTLSQIAIMMFSISIMATKIAFFHLITHAFFKSSMFLCAGALIHSSSYQDMRNMTSQFNSTPIIHSMLGLNSLALMGLPFMSGFFSKDAIMEFMLFSKTNLILSMLMISSITMTSIYTIRMNLLSSKFIHKAKPDINMNMSNQITIPILVLSPLSIIMGSMMMWLIMPNQLFILPTIIKNTILIMLTSGILFSLSTSFQSKKFIKLMEPSISLWFSHFMSSQFMKFINPISILPLKNDLSWQEMYGPNMSLMINKSTSKPMISILNNSLFTFTLIMMIPLLMM